MGEDAVQRWNMERACIIRAVEMEMPDSDAIQSSHLLQKCSNWLQKNGRVPWLQQNLECLIHLLFAPRNGAFYVEEDGERYLQIQQEGECTPSRTRENVE